MLGLIFDLSRPNYPRVQIAVDGSTEFDGGEHPMGHNPERLLDSGALLPRAVPHRVAVSGCSCGEFGCSTLTALIVAAGDEVRWTDFAEAGGGIFDEALPYGELPDPLAVSELSDPLAVSRPTLINGTGELIFDRHQYLTVIDTATGIRSWETRARAVSRLTRQALEWDLESQGTVMAWEEEQRAVAVNIRTHGRWSTYLIPIPDGPSEEAASRLASLLRSRHPSMLDGARLLNL